MIRALELDYRQLGLDSSNLMMEWSGQRAQGRYEIAAQAMLEAGAIRQAMAMQAVANEQFDRAAENWLTTAGCFLESSLPDQAEPSILAVQDLEKRGRISEGRLDLLHALRNRENELVELRDKIACFAADTAGGVPTDRAAAQQHLDWLLKRVRDLPGLPALHRRIEAVALALGDDALAARHAQWAETFRKQAESLAYYRV